MVPSSSLLLLLYATLAISHTFWVASAVPTCAVTAADVQGPFFQFSGVPNKGDWICQGKHRRWGPPEIDAEVVVITGRVLDEDCKTPVGGAGKAAVIHVWQADSDGRYDDHMDESSHYCRGRIKVGKDGGYRIRSILPGRYGSRPRHFHIQVEAEGYRTVITQLYIPGDTRLESAARGEKDLSRRLDFEENGRAKYDFVLRKAP